MNNQVLKNASIFSNFPQIFLNSKESQLNPHAKRRKNAVSGCGILQSVKLLIAQGRAAGEKEMPD